MDKKWMFPCFIEKHPLEIFEILGFLILLFETIVGPNTDF